MKRFTIGLTLLTLCACTTQHTVLEERKSDGSYRKTAITTRSVWDAKSELAKLKTTNTEKTQSMGIEGLQQESSSTNVINVIEAIVGAAVKAAK